MNGKRPYSEEDYLKAKEQGFDLDDWNDYCAYFNIGSEEEQDFWRE